MKIGIAGGIGSGKSYVCQKIEQRGFEIYDCDRAAKRLIRQSADIRQRLISLIGPEAYEVTTDENGAANYILNKSIIRSLHFNSYGYFLEKVIVITCYNNSAV